ncbi:MAG: hypothetical protein AAGA80_16075, partial [Cyanobacteria bacterium P01_F01_bin.143]
MVAMNGQKKLHAQENSLQAVNSIMVIIDNSGSLGCPYKSIDCPSDTKPSYKVAEKWVDDARNIIKTDYINNKNL